MRRKLTSAAIAVVVLGVVAVGNDPASTQVAVHRNPALAMALAAEQGTAPPRLPNGNFVPMLSGGVVAGRKPE